jgi:hypothetical protein
MHEFPCGMPENVKKQPIPGEKTKRIHDDTNMICTRWACGMEYTPGNNHKGCCQHHPGVYQFGSWMGLWPESWSCCRQPWDAIGCSKGKHKGTIKENPS